MKEFIDAIKAGDLVGMKKQFISIMENRQEALRQELRVEIAEAVRCEGETDEEDETEKCDKSEDKKDKEPSEKDETE